MLILGLNIGKERYGIEATLVIEVVPLIVLKKVPLTERCIKGLFNYRGAPTPVIDLCQLFEKRDCNNSLSSRIIIIEYQTLSGDSRPIGLIGEKVTDIIKCKVDEVANNGIHKEQNDFLGLIYKHNNEMIQLINILKVLPDTINNQLTNNF